jgi:hypothetical protein
MRTTLDIDEDVLLACKALAICRGTTTGRVISVLARSTLVKKHGAVELNELRATYGFLPFPARGGVVTTELVRLIA